MLLNKKLPFAQYLIQCSLLLTTLVDITVYTTFASGNKSTLFLTLGKYVLLLCSVQIIFNVI